MPGSMEFATSGRGAVFHGTGVLTGQEVLEVKRRLAEDEARVRRLDFILVLLDGVRTFTMSMEEVRDMVRIDDRLALLAPRLKIAIVAPQDHDFGVARMWESMVRLPGWTTNVFRARGEAEAWLRSALELHDRDLRTA